MEKGNHFDKNNNQGHGASQEVLYYWDTLKQQWVEYETISVTTPLDPAKDTEKRGKRKLPKLKKPDDGLDIAHIKDADIFRYVLRIAPGMKQIIALIRECSPARSGEYDHLLDSLHNKPLDRSAVENRLFEIGLRMALKNALLCSVKHRVDLEDAFQTACIGLLRAIREHDAMESSSFPVYSKRWVNRAMNSDLPIYEKNFCLPLQEKESIGKKLHVIEAEESDIELVQELSKRDLYELLKTYANCNETEADHIATILTPFESTEELAEIEEADSSMNSDYNAFTNKMIEDIDHEEFHNNLEDYFALLRNGGKSRMVSILKMRYGFDGEEPMSLEQIGNKLGITRERVRQIEAKGVNMMRHRLKSRLFSLNENGASMSVNHTVNTDSVHIDHSKKAKKSNKSVQLPSASAKPAKNLKPSTKLSSSRGFTPGHIRKKTSKPKGKKNGYGEYIADYEIIGSNIRNKRTGVLLFDASIKKLSLSKEDRAALKEKRIDLISEIIGLPFGKQFLNDEQENRIKATVLRYLYNAEEILEKKRET